MQDRSRLYVFLGLFAYFALFTGGIYWAKGVLLGEDGFKGCLLGSLLGLAAYFILSIAIGETLKKLVGDKPWREAAMGAALLAVSLAYSGRVVRPILNSDPSTYYYGTATGQYEVHFTDGHSETHSGSELGAKKWGWAIGFHGSMGLVNLCGALVVLASGGRDWLRRKV